MTDFYDLIDEYIGDSDNLADIRCVVRRLYFFDFTDYPVYLWQGKGALITSDNIRWLGTINAQNQDTIVCPAIQDGRDNTSASYEFTLNIPDLPGQPALETYNELKADQSQVYGQNLTIYLAVFQPGEGLRPQTPYVFYKQLTMFSPKFSEGLTPNNNGGYTRQYKVSVVTKDANYGRTNMPNGTYADTIQRQRALELGVSVDLGAEYLAQLANRTYTLP